MQSTGDLEITGLRVSWELHGPQAIEGPKNGMEEMCHQHLARSTQMIQILARNNSKTKYEIIFSI